MKYILNCFLYIVCTFCATICMADTELVSMFSEGLAIYKDNPAKAAAMVETSVLQSTLDPIQFSNIWDVYKKSDILKSAKNSSRIAMLDVFLECSRKTCQNCKNRSDFNKIWDIQQDIQNLREKTINNECSIARKALNSSDIDSLLKHRENFVFLLEYADESNEENSKFLQELSNRIVSRFDTFETRYQKLKNGCNNIDWNIFIEQFRKNPLKFEIGETTRLIMDIRDFLLYLQSPEISILMERYPPIKNPLEQGEKILDKAQKLNRVRYNLWANWMLYNFGDDVAAADVLSRISPEFLYTPVEVVFQEKQEKLYQNTKNPIGLASILQRLILEEKVPLSAF